MRSGWPATGSAVKLSGAGVGSAQAYFVPGNMLTGWGCNRTAVVDYGRAGVRGVWRDGSVAGAAVGTVLPVTEAGGASLVPGWT
jgi:hypothetical protein